MVHKEDVNLLTDVHPIGTILHTYDRTLEPIIIVTTGDVILYTLEEAEGKTIHYTKEDLVELNIQDIIMYVSENKIAEYE
jgi:hypothetical protein